jgi:hypothetical protein
MQMDQISSFFRELKQRKIYRVAVGYAVVACLDQRFQRLCGEKVK